MVYHDYVSFVMGKELCHLLEELCSHRYRLSDHSYELETQVTKQQRYESPLSGKTL